MIDGRRTRPGTLLVWNNVRVVMLGLHPHYASRRRERGTVRVLWEGSHRTEFYVHEGDLVVWEPSLVAYNFVINSTDSTMSFNTGSSNV